MIWFIISVVLLLIGIICCLFEDSRMAGIVSLILAGVLFLISLVGFVPTGYTGILVTFGAVSDKTLSAGINIKAPWQSIVKMDNRTQKVEINTSAFSSDIQQVDLQMSINYCIDQQTAQTLYRTVGKNYYENVMLPRILENTKATFSKYTAENLISKRDLLSDSIADMTSADMANYGISIISIAVEDIDFTDAFTSAVEAKQVAAQNKLTAETEQAQKTMEEQAAAERAIISANAKAEQNIIAANADLEVTKIKADADLYAGQKEAEKINAISSALTNNYISYENIHQWNGELPETILGSDNSYMIGLNK